MNLEKAIKNINRSLTKKQPISFNPIWIKYRCKASYEFIIDSIKNELGEPDWDLITFKLDRQFQKLWMKGLKKKFTQPGYESKEEVLLILNKYKDKLYSFVSQVDQDDKRICDFISIKLVRLAQKGNVLAKRELVKFVNFLIAQWIEGYKLSRWRGYDDLISECLDACIRRYRYSGSFLGYLNRTLEYSGRPLKSIEPFSLDNESKITGKRLVDKVAKNYNTGEVKFFR